MSNPKIVLSALLVALTVFTAATAQTTTPGVGTGASGLGKGPSSVILGQSGQYVILAKTGISTTGTTAITGDIGVSPAAGSFITGFSLLAPPTTFATSAKVTGKVYAADYNSPTPANLTTAVLDMGTAYSDAAARPLDYTELGTGNIGGMTLAPAVYKWSGNVTIPSNVTLSGGANDVWIFQIAGNLSVSSAVNVFLQGGALPKNIYWQVAGAVSLGTTSHFEGVVLAQTAIALNTGASANSRFLTKTAVTLDANSVVQPNTPVSIARGLNNGKNLNASNDIRTLIVNVPGKKLSFPLVAGTVNRVAIMDVWGRTMWAKTLTAAPGMDHYLWNGITTNGAHLAPGVYQAVITQR